MKPAIVAREVRARCARGSRGEGNQTLTCSGMQTYAYDPHMFLLLCKTFRLFYPDPLEDKQSALTHAERLGLA